MHLIQFQFTITESTFLGRTPFLCFSVYRYPIFYEQIRLIDLDEITMDQVSNILLRSGYSVQRIRLYQEDFQNFFENPYVVALLKFLIRNSIQQPPPRPMFHSFTGFVISSIIIKMILNNLLPM